MTALKNLVLKSVKNKLGEIVHLKRYKIYMTEDTFHALNESYSGICLACCSINEGDHEPDAENYHCNNCEKDKSMGIENAMISGKINIIDNDEIENLLIAGAKKIY